VFANANIQITARSQRHLGAVLGSREFAEEYVAEKVQSWVSEVSALAQIADSRPHAVYTTFMHGLIGRWVYLIRTVPDISSFFKHWRVPSDSSFFHPSLVTLPVLPLNGICCRFLVV